MFEIRYAICTELFRHNATDRTRPLPAAQARGASGPGSWSIRALEAEIARGSNPRPKPPTSVGARGWGEAFTSVYLDADKIGGKPGVQFLRTAALETWTEPAVVPVPPAHAGRCPQIDLRSLPADGSHLTERLHAQTWAPTLYELGSSEATGPYHYDWCREHWALVLGGVPTLRHPCGQDVMAPGDIVCLPEGEAGAHQFLNHADEPARLLVCSAPVTGPSAAVYPDDDTYVLHVPGQMGYRFRLSDQLLDYWDGEPGAGSA